jgi:hypothetical protein
MAIVPNTPEFTFLFILVIINLAVKMTFAIYLGSKVARRNKEKGKFEFDFLFSVFIVAVGAFISRSIYLYYDFVLVQFNEANLWIYPNVVYWKWGGLIGALGLITVLYTIDKKVLNNKFKGIIAYYALTVILIQFFWPINTKEDFEFASSLMLFGLIAFAVIPVIFLYLAVKTPGLRGICLLMFFGILIYAGGSFIVSENFLAPIREAFGEQADFTAYVIFYVSKIIGLGMLVYGVTRFSL